MKCLWKRSGSSEAYTNISNSVLFESAKHVDGNFTIKTDKNVNCPANYSDSDTIFYGGITIPRVMNQNATFVCNAANVSFTYPSPVYIGSSANNTSDSNGLSAGAIAGIVIGIVIAVALLILAAFLLWRRRRRRAYAAAKQEETSEHAEGYGKAELDSEATQLQIGELPADKDAQEIGGHAKGPTLELESKDQVAELPQPTFELAGDSVWRTLSRKKSKGTKSLASPVSDLSESQKNQVSPLADAANETATSPPVVSPVLGPAERDHD